MCVKCIIGADHANVFPDYGNDLQSYLLRALRLKWGALSQERPQGQWGKTVYHFAYLFLPNNFRDTGVTLWFLHDICFIHPIFHFWFSVTFGYKDTKILPNLCLHFARQDGQDRKNWKENHATKVNKIPKTKRRKYGMNETYVNHIAVTPSKFSKFRRPFILQPGAEIPRLSNVTQPHKGSS